jgi:hypothetical protein
MHLRALRVFSSSSPSIPSRFSSSSLSVLLPAELLSDNVLQAAVVVFRYFMLAKCCKLPFLWVIDVVDLHEVLVPRFLLCPARLLVMTQPVLEV